MFGRKFLKRDPHPEIQSDFPLRWRLPTALYNLLPPYKRHSQKALYPAFFHDKIFLKVVMILKKLS